ncbi:HNH endonuclease [Lysinibacillus xylanilyticus]|uniref:HNH endonuclease n=1 Tax=Lysinibacillus xylanilyticus TaxID=582475 RepID=UPI00083C9DD7|nr:HNH endonuclease [Lysinibacillus xylanilyticus]
MLTKDEVKKLFTLSDNSLREYRNLGMPFNKIGRDYEYPKDEVIRWQRDRQDLVATKLEVGKNYLNQEISGILLCSDQGGMKRSRSTGTLTIFTDTVDSRNPYQDLWKGGEDTIENCVALCPNCHRKMHSLALNEDING